MFTIEDRAIDPAVNDPSGAEADGPSAVPVAFIGRCAPTAGPRVPKYLNTSAYTKGRVLYGLAEHADALAAGATPVLVEGPADAEAITRAGVATSQGGAPAFVGIATCGTALTAEHVAALADVVDLEHRTVLVATDYDAGKKAAERGWRLLRDAGCAETRTVDLAAHNDPAEVLQVEGPAALAAALEASSNATGIDAVRRSLHAQVIDARLQEWAPVLDHLDGRLRALAADVAVGTPDQQAYATAQLVVRIDLDDETIHRELDHLGFERAAALADHPAWPALRDLGRVDLDALRDALAAHDAQHVSASTLLWAIAPTRPAASPTDSEPALPPVSEAPGVEPITEEAVRRPPRDRPRPAT